MVRAPIRFVLWMLGSGLIASILLNVSTEQEDELILSPARWMEFRGESFPPNSFEGSPRQPVVGSQGVELDLERCRTNGEELSYKVRLHSPYDSVLTAVVLASTDEASNEVGTYWGMFYVRVQPGRSQTVLSSNAAPDDEAVLARIADGSGKSCAVHLVGFQEGPNFRVRSIISVASMEVG